MSIYSAFCCRYDHVGDALVEDLHARPIRSAQLRPILERLQARAHATALFSPKSRATSGQRAAFGYVGGDADYDDDDASSGGGAATTPYSPTGGRGGFFESPLQAPLAAGAMTGMRRSSSGTRDHTS